MNNNMKLFNLNSTKTLIIPFLMTIIGTTYMLKKYF